MDTNDELRLIMAKAPLTLVQVSMLTNVSPDRVGTWCVGQKMKSFRVMPKDSLNLLKNGIKYGQLVRLSA
jgi:hypothetical protein